MRTMRVEFGEHRGAQGGTGGRFQGRGSCGWKLCGRRKGTTDAQTTD